MLSHQDGSPTGGPWRGDLFHRNPARRNGLVLQQADECVQMRGEEILAPKVTTMRCLTLPPSRNDSTRRRYSCRPLAALTGGRNKVHSKTLQVNDQKHLYSSDK